MNQYSVNASDMISVANEIREKNETSEQLAFPEGWKDAIRGIKTGVELNFEVVGGTTQPENPKENTIWVNTPNEVTGWSFSVTEPDVNTEGFVWLLTHSNGELAFNALKNNAIIIQPVLCRQYHIEEWNQMEVSAYVNGMWVSLDKFLSEYQPVEYLQSTGTQYIDTGYCRNANTEYEIEYEVNSVDSYRWAMGSTNNNFFGVQIASATSQYIWVGQSNDDLGPLVTISLNTKYTVVYKNKTVYFDGKAIQTVSGSGSSTQSAFLFALHNDGNAGSHANVKIYSAKFYENGILRRDFVPCYRRSDSVAGMYDRVTETFFTNMGTGTFIVGGDVE